MKPFHFTPAARRAIIFLCFAIAALMLAEFGMHDRLQSQQIAALEVRIAELEARSQDFRPQSASPSRTNYSNSRRSAAPRKNTSSPGDKPSARAAAPAPTSAKDSSRAASSRAADIDTTALQAPSSDDDAGIAYEEYAPYDYLPKFRTPQFIDLNTADSATLVRIPGIGAATTRAILRYRTRLGGYISPWQVAEAVRWADSTQVEEWCASWLTADTTRITPLPINTADFRTLLHHPYLEYEQVCAISDLRRRRGHIRSINELWGLKEFNDADIERLRPYLSFQ